MQKSLLLQSRAPRSVTRFALRHDGMQYRRRASRRSRPPRPSSASSRSPKPRSARQPRRRVRGLPVRRRRLRGCALRRSLCRRPYSRRPLHSRRGPRDPLQSSWTQRSGSSPTAPDRMKRPAPVRRSILKQHGFTNVDSDPRRVRGWIDAGLPGRAVPRRREIQSRKLTSVKLRELKKSDGS